MNNKNYHTVGTIPKSYIKIVERGKIYTTNTQIYDGSLSWLGTGTSIKCGGVTLFLCLSEMMQLHIPEEY